jgi:hypothetical protein
MVPERPPVRAWLTWQTTPGISGPSNALTYTRSFLPTKVVLTQERSSDQSNEIVVLRRIAGRCLDRLFLSVRILGEPIDVRSGSPASDDRKSAACQFNGDGTTNPLRAPDYPEPAHGQIFRSAWAPPVGKLSQAMPDWRYRRLPHTRWHATACPAPTSLMWGTSLQIALASGQRDRYRHPFASAGGAGSADAVSEPARPRVPRS